jgi:hypothetical protein
MHVLVKRAAESSTLTAMFVFLRFLILTPLCGFPIVGPERCGGSEGDRNRYQHRHGCPPGGHGECHGSILLPELAGRPLRYRHRRRRLQNLSACEYYGRGQQHYFGRRGARSGRKLANGDSNRIGPAGGDGQHSTRRRHHGLEHHRFAAERAQLYRPAGARTRRDAGYDDHIADGSRAGPEHLLSLRRFEPWNAFHQRPERVR